MQGNRMIWIDLETTGLDPNSDIPLELGLAITDKFGEIEAEKSWLIHENTPEWLASIERGIAHPIVGPMHESSGLWTDLVLKQSIANSRAMTDILVSSWLYDNNFPQNTFPMCGSSIGSLDRPFVAKYFPITNTYFHYRSIDITTIKEVCKLHNPGLAEYYTNEYLKDNSGPDHRVLSDIRASIHEYQFYLKHFLKVAE